MALERWRPAPVVWVAVGVEGVALALAWVIGRLGGHPVSEAFGGRATDALWGILATAPLVGFLGWTVRTSWRPIVELRIHVYRDIRPMFASTGIGGLIAISVLAGLAEEALFRGALLGALTPSLGVGGAVLATTVLFGLAHPVTWLYAILAASIGLYLAVLTLAAGTLITPAVTHALYDVIGLLYLTRRPAAVSPETD